MKNLKSIAEHSDWLEDKGNLNDSEKWLLHRKRVIFGKQPLELWQFVPCDEDGNVLEEPEPIHTYGLEPCDYEYDDNEILKYQQAEERCLFEGFTFKEETKDTYFLLKEGIYTFALTKLRPRLIESLVGMDKLTLTQTAIKQLGL